MASAGGAVDLSTCPSSKISSIIIHHERYDIALHYIRQARLLSFFVFGDRPISIQLEAYIEDDIA